jgi:hypothetical protein
MRLYTKLSTERNAGLSEFTFSYPGLRTCGVRVSSFELAGNLITYARLLDSRVRTRQLVLNLRDLVNACGPSVTPASRILACKHTWHLARDRLATWAANALHVHACQPQQFGLIALPSEALIHILRRTTWEDVLAVSEVCSRLRGEANDDDLWEELYKKEFNTKCPQSEVRHFHLSFNK